jgi:hypothetical protein
MEKTFKEILQLVSEGKQITFMPKYGSPGVFRVLIEPYIMQGIYKKFQFDTTSEGVELLEPEVFDEVFSHNIKKASKAID